MGALPPGAFFLFALAAGCAERIGAAPTEVETVRLERAGTPITRSCRVEIPAEPIPDPLNEGVLRIVADGVTVELAGEPLCGAPVGTDPDEYRGIGIAIAARDVTLRGARVRGFRVGIHARESHGLALLDCDVSGNFRQRLRSTRVFSDCTRPPDTNGGNQGLGGAGEG